MKIISEILFVLGLTLVLMPAYRSCYAGKLENTLFVRHLCHARPNGFKMSVPGSCSQYYECINGRTHLQTCPNFYDFELGLCVATNTGCTEAISKMKSSCSGPCCGMSNGYAVNYENQQIFYKCKENNVVSINTCPGNLEFNIVDSICDTPSHCDKCSETVTTVAPPCITKTCTSSTTICIHRTSTTPTETTPIAVSTTTCSTPIITTDISTETAITSTATESTGSTSSDRPGFSTSSSSVTTSTISSSTRISTYSSTICYPTTTTCFPTSTTRSSTRRPTTCSPISTSSSTIMSTDSSSTSAITGSSTHGMTSSQSVTPTSTCIQTTTQYAPTTPSTPCSTTTCRTTHSITTSCIWTTTTCPISTTNCILLNDPDQNASDNAPVSGVVKPPQTLQTNIDLYMRYVCRDKQNGFILASLKSCNQYYMCNFGLAIPISCGEKYFNALKGICDEPENTGCIQSQSYRYVQ